MNRIPPSLVRLPQVEAKPRVVPERTRRARLERAERITRPRGIRRFAEGGTVYAEQDDERLYYAPSSTYADQYGQAAADPYSPWDEVEEQVAYGYAEPYYEPDARAASHWEEPEYYSPAMDEALGYYENVRATMGDYLTGWSNYEEQVSDEEIEADVIGRQGLSDVQDATAFATASGQGYVSPEMQRGAAELADFYFEHGEPGKAVETLRGANIPVDAPGVGEAFGRFNQSTGIPYVTDWLQDTGVPYAAKAVGIAGRGMDISRGGYGDVEAGAPVVAETFIPTTGFEIASTFAPVVGDIPIDDVIRGVRGSKVAGGLSRFAESALPPAKPGSTYAGVPSPRDPMAEWEYTLKKLQAAKEEGGEAAVKAEQARLTEIANAKIADQQAAEKANRGLRWGDTAKGELEETRAAMAEAAETLEDMRAQIRAAREAEAKITGDTEMFAGVPVSKTNLEEIIKDEKYLRGEGVDYGTPAKAKPKPSVVDEIMGILGVPQTLMATGDVSAIGRQAQVLGWSNPREWKEAAEAGIKAFASEDAALAARAAMEENAWFKFFDDAGGKIYDWGDGIKAGERVPGFTGLNESWVSRRVGGFKPIKASERAYATTLNVQGMDVFAKVAQSMWDSGVRNVEAFTDLAAVINHARGYGTGRIADMASASNVFFSGRNWVSRFQVLLDPFTKSGSLLQPSARQLAAKNLASFIAGNAALMGFLGVTGAMAGGAWSVNADPRSSDFGKLKIGKTRFDTMAGFGPIVRLFARAGAPREYDDWRTELVRFFRNKEAPIPSLITDIVSGKDWKGDPFKLTPERMAEMFVPFLAGEVYEALTQNEGWNKLLAAPVAAASALGAGTGSYGTFAEDQNRWAGKLYKQDFDDLNLIDKAKVQAAMAADGYDFDLWDRAGIYFDADDEAFEIAKQQNEVLAEFDSLADFREEAIRRFIAAGALKQDAQNILQGMEADLGLTKVTKAGRKAIIAEDPGIVDALQKLYEEGELTFPPSKELREFAAEVLAEKTGAPR